MVWHLRSRETYYLEAVRRRHIVSHMTVCVMYKVVMMCTYLTFVRINKDKDLLMRLTLLGENW